MRATSKITSGTAVVVRHDLGEETGVVVGSANVLPGEIQTYTVEFADRTRSTWPAFVVRVSESKGN